MILLIDDLVTASISYNKNGSTDFNSIDIQFGINYIGNLKHCASYNVKTSITCTNEKLKK